MTAIPYCVTAIDSEHDYKYRYFISFPLRKRKKVITTIPSDKIFLREMKLWLLQVAFVSLQYRVETLKFCQWHTFLNLYVKGFSIIYL